MIIFVLVALAAHQVELSQACVDNDHIVSPADPHHQSDCQPPVAPQCPCPCPYGHDVQCGCGLQCPCDPHNVVHAGPSQPFISSVTRIASTPCCSPVLQSAIQCPLYPEPLVPVVENHVGHQVFKSFKRVPIVRKYCRPELVIRTRHVPVIKHRKRVFIEPYPSIIPITDKLIRQVIHEITHRIPVVHKCVKPVTYQTVRHVPLSCAQCACGESVPPTPCSHFNCPSNCPCSADNLPPPNFPVGCNAPCHCGCDASHPPPTCCNPCFS